MAICLERGADLHTAQLMPLPLTVSCFSKIQIGFTFLVPAHPGSPGQRAVKRVCVCACVRACVCVCVLETSLHFGQKPKDIGKRNSSRCSPLTSTKKKKYDIKFKITKVCLPGLRIHIIQVASVVTRVTILSSDTAIDTAAASDVIASSCAGYI